MLYVTTRNNRDAYTSFRALNEDRGPDGGFYVPMRLKGLPEPAVEVGRSFGQAVAETLNLLFRAKLTGWDVDFAIGRAPVQLKAMNHRILIAEAWHNPQWYFQKAVEELRPRIHPMVDQSREVGDWAEIAVRIAFLSGIFARLSEGSQGRNVDLVVPSGDFSGMMSAWYARQWGLPIGNIVCCCDESAGLWDLLHQGNLRTAASAVPRDLERLVFACGGYWETELFQDCCRKGRPYRPSEPVLSRMQEGLYVSVVGQKRLESTLINVFRTHSRVLGPQDALCYAGLQDYRAGAGESGPALLLSERSPLLDGKLLCELLGISSRQLGECMNRM